MVLGLYTCNYWRKIIEIILHWFDFVHRPFLKLRTTFWGQDWSPSSGKKENAIPTQYVRRQGWWQGQIQSPKSVCIVLFYSWTSSSSSVGPTARCGLWPVEQYLSICPYLSATLSIFSHPTLEDLFPLLLSTLSWVFLFVSARPVLEWRSFWASYPPPFSPGDPTNLPFAPLSILLYFLLYSTLLVLDSS